MQNPAPESPETPPRKGRLYVVATPIGNLEDITVRALRLLGEADLIACEDTRHTLKVLNHYGIHKPTLSYHQHNEASRAEELLKRLEQGAQIALVSDAGTPIISDPGYRLVSVCLEKQIPVIPIPGPSAVIAALAASRLPSAEFVFVGFLPSLPAARRKALQNLAKETHAMALYEAPHRLVDTLYDAPEGPGPRPARLARAITKEHEEVFGDGFAQLLLAGQRRP